MKQRKCNTHKMKAIVCLMSIMAFNSLTKSHLSGLMNLTAFVEEQMNAGQA